MADKSDWIVAGFQFGTEKDAALAKGEQLKIEKLEDKIDYSKPEMVSAVYNKAVVNRIFKTPVGYEFLKKLQMILKETPDFSEEVADIPVQGVYSLRESTTPAVEKIKASTVKKKEKPRREPISVKILLFINIVLVLLVAAMFFIAMTGSSPTVINYERAVQNKYSKWEQELSERESVIREKEKELLIQE